jgi:hypothetical protein
MLLSELFIVTGQGLRQYVLITAIHYDLNFCTPLVYMLKIKRKLNELAWTCIFLFQFYRYESVKPNSRAGFKSSFFAAPEHWWNFYHRRITICSCKQLCKFEGMYVCTFCSTFPTFLRLEQITCITHSLSRLVVGPIMELTIFMQT